MSWKRRAGSLVPRARAANVGQRHDSIEHYLIEGWLSEGESV